MNQNFSKKLSKCNRQTANASTYSVAHVFTRSTYVSLVCSVDHFESEKWFLVPWPINFFPHFFLFKMEAHCALIEGGVMSDD